MGSTSLSKGTLLGYSAEPKDGSWGFKLPALGLGLLSAFRLSKESLSNFANA